VHGEHDIVVHRPVQVGERLRTWVEGHGARPAGGNALVTLRYLTLDERDEIVAEQWWTTVWLGADRTTTEAGWESDAIASPAQPTSGPRCVRRRHPSP